MYICFYKNKTVLHKSVTLDAYLWKIFLKNPLEGLFFLNFSPVESHLENIPENVLKFAFLSTSLSHHVWHYLYQFRNQHRENVPCMCQTHTCQFCRSRVKMKGRICNRSPNQKILIWILPASGGLYSKSNQESVYDFHLLCQCFQYSLNQPVKDKGETFEGRRQMSTW